MEWNDQSAKEFLARSDVIIDRLREVALREFAKGADGLRLIIKELAQAQSFADEHGLQGLVGCLGDISLMLQGWIDHAVFLEQLTTLSSPWTDVVCELVNSFVFLGAVDEAELREQVNHRLVQLTKATAALLPVTATPPRTPMAAETVESSLSSHYLICLLGSQQYALPINQVREILRERREKSLPAPRPGIVGLVTVRGQVCPVVDAAEILQARDHAAQPPRNHNKRCMVVCEVDRRTFCLNVDDVKQVAAIHEFQDQIKPLDADDAIQTAISHVSHFQNRSVLFVKMREVIPA
ncbi:chemotaxis protein CheW [Oligoflexus tunisiensis]|uniref:chemotaxis protein CheW n=1 Tax=Oligoflexus tunisiensis TaxID=708132 RepID=UPI000B1C9A3A|nr:chemotaxis protein CheW [Oligoflexus tunisiensis]